VRIVASTIFDQTEYLANDLHIIFRLVSGIAADAISYCIDDTTNRILNQKPIQKKQRNSNKERTRTGVYSSGLIAMTKDGHKIVLFETNIGHAGEFIDSILTHRDPSLPAPVVMSDALSSNIPTVTKTVTSLCNSHARREFYDIVSHFPDEVQYILKRYKEIWINETTTVEQELSPAERLAYHQTHSLGIMEEIQSWGKQHLEQKTVEQNSALGKAISYFNKHFTELSCFCRMEGVKLDNNEMEAQLKLVVRNRKNAMFYKTLSGASIADVVTSMIATTIHAGASVFDYFNLLQRDQEKVKANPLNYLPWNYQKNQ
jgi:hypothetical protein